MAKSRTQRYHLFGIRHHGPGSSRTLLLALEELQPDLVLVEGPADASELLPWLNHPDMKPPVALMVYAEAAPATCSFYPMAVFSPEFQAICYALDRSIPVRFIDLPAQHMLAMREPRPGHVEPGKEEAPGDEQGVTSDDSSEELNAGEPAAGEDDSESLARADPFVMMAQVAGFRDPERWWELLVENRRDASPRDVFAGIREVMKAMRQDTRAESRARKLNECREAWMRQTLQGALKEGFERIAVVCGAWHVPALEELPAVKADREITRGLPKQKVKATWTPWTYGRLSSRSGYGAGISSPGWYQHLWDYFSRRDASQRIAAGWLTKVARALRAADHDISPAHVIEAVRLTEALTAMRGVAKPGLDELTEATQAVMLGGDAAPLALVERQVIVGERMGAVPESLPVTPLQADLASRQKSLRMKLEAERKIIELDLRKPNDLDKSQLLHRLLLIRVPWGMPSDEARQSRGTFRETWELQWSPELEVALVAASPWGPTVLEAAIECVRMRAGEATNLAQLTTLLGEVLLAGLPQAAIHNLLSLIENKAAMASDVSQMMDALPPLAHTMRYGNVRGDSSGQLAHIVEGLLTRVCIGFIGACQSLDDDAAGAMAKRLINLHEALGPVATPEQRSRWLATLDALAQRDGLHGLIEGRANRLLLDEGSLTPEEAARRLSFALSRASDYLQAGWWIEGLLKGSGLLILHSEALWNVIDRFVCSIPPQDFLDMVPVLRRTFSSFETAERRMMGERVNTSAPPIPSGSPHLGVQGEADAGAEMAEDTMEEAYAMRMTPFLERVFVAS